MTDESKEEKSEGALMPGNEKATLFPSPSHIHGASDLLTPAEDLNAYSLSRQLHTHTPSP